MKKTVSRIMALFLTLLMVSAIFCTTFYASAEPEAETTDLPDIQVNLDENTSATAYDAYISSNKASKPGENIEVDTKIKVTKDASNFSVSVKETALYTLGFSYVATDKSNSKLIFSLKLDGAVPFDEANKLILNRIFENDGKTRKDGMGNEFAPAQVMSKSYYFDTVNDVTGWTNNPYMFYLTEGEHTFELTGLYGEFKIEKVVLGGAYTPDDYKAPKKNLYSGKPVIIEGEDAVLKTNYWLAGKGDNSTPVITPSSAYNTLVNYIGGGNWSANGDTLVWNTPKMKAGYYNIAFMYRQSSIIGAKVYRDLKIDGVTPFKQARSVGFGYSYNWKETVFSDSKENPYYIYLPEGKHTISLTVVPGEIENVRNLLKQAVADVGSLYIDITTITGETVDTYRDYDLFSQIADMEKRLKTIRKELLDCSDELKKTTGEKSGSYISIIDNMRQVVELMLDNRYSSHRYKSNYYSKYTSLASVLNEMSSMPLDIDKISLFAKNTEPFEKVGFFEKAGYSVQRFLTSFVSDYNNISNNSENSDSITIWVDWGRDQAQVLNSLIQTSFTPQTKVAVNVQLVNASVVQAVLSGKGPDCLLQHSRSEPVNLAMRGVLYDMTKFKDLPDVLKNFGEEAALPYYYKGGLYGLPDTQSFYLMYYRKDILDSMNLKVPETWDEFRETVNLLEIHNLTAWLPNNTATSVGQANAGIGSINIFPSLMLQNNVDIYKADGKSTNLSSPETSTVFNEWTAYYTKLRLPRTMDFYNRFRTGSCPLGISTHTMYTTLKAAAPEIDGKWSVSLIPGTPQEDGTVCHTSSGGGTACSIMKSTSNPEASWKFIKWWLSAETQISFSNEIETILGPTGRVSVSNKEAFASLEWDIDMKDTIVEAFNQIREIPEYPGSYYVSRSVYQSYWNVVENNQSPKETLLKYSEEANVEIKRKWLQYENR